MSLGSSFLKLFSFDSYPAHRRRETASLPPALVSTLESRELLASLSPSAATPPADFDDDWYINGQNQFILTIHQDGNNVTGGFNSPFFAYSVTGKVNGNVMTIRGKSTSALKAHFKAQVALNSSNSFSGVITGKIQGTPKSNGAFEGVKV